MSPKRKPQLTRKERKLRHEEREKQRQKQEDESLIQDTAAVFTCFYEVTRDFTNQCEDAIEDVETNVIFARIARELWKTQSGRSEEFNSALAEFIAERERHHAALSKLQTRFARLTDPPVHEHLDPVEHYRDIVRNLLFPDGRPATFKPLDRQIPTI